MPIYEFKCGDCGTITEALVFTVEGQSKCTCKNCGGDRTTRIMSRPVVVTGRGCGGGLGDQISSHYDSNGADCPGAGKWPDNEDYIRLKGQQ